MTEKKRIKRVCAIHDLSAFGRCALTVVIPTLSAMGVQVIPLPTALLSTHTGGFDDIYAVDLTESMEKIYTHWEKLGVKFDAIYSGFVLSSEQCAVISDFRRRFANDGCTVITDPVFADDGEFYSTYTKEIANEMRTLCKGSDIITPNLTEACELVGESFVNTEKMSEAELREFVSSLLLRLSALGAKKIAITGIPTTLDGAPAVATAAIDLAKEHSEPFFVTLPRLDARYHGTGELFASVLIGKLLGGEQFEDAVDSASRFVRDTVDMSTEYPTPIRAGVALEAALGNLIK